MRFFKIAVGALLYAMLASATAGTQVYFHKFYSGKIAGKYAFTMDLKNIDGKLSGLYRYAGKTDQLYLNGSVDAAGAVKMDELSSSKISGHFAGTMAGTGLSGTWTSADGGKTLPFAASQTSEVLIGSKKEILAKTIGDYMLTNIEGSGGANGMWETWKQKGKWGANISGISGGMRTATAVALNRNDIRLLDSMTIRVDPEFGVRLLASGKTVMAIPYREQGMQIELSHAASRDIDQLQQLKPDTTVLDEHLYLLAKSGVDYSSAIHGNFEGAVGGVVIVSYAITDDTFGVTFYPDECCGESSFTFARRPKR